MLELIWQSAVLSCVIYQVTQWIIMLIDVDLANAKGKASVVRKLGMERRKDNAILSLLIIPAIAPMLGFFVAAVVPMRPDIIVGYVTMSPENLAWGRVIYGFWGAVCGGFSSFAYDKVRDIISGFNIGSGGKNGNEG